VVIPVHNQFSYTHHCLAALAHVGARRAFEVILVDDCSSDGTAERLARLPRSAPDPQPRESGVRRILQSRGGGRAGRLSGLSEQRYPGPTRLAGCLIDTFEDAPDAGIVGSRLLYPDGRQQEAGAILFADGTAWNYGHLDAPDKPQYSYRRAVDYCSGAALAIETALFRRLGGFDSAFAPAYYEDVDLAFRVRVAGRAVYYQPLSRVVHFEGISAGRDEQTETGLKRYQRINAETFRTRWAEVLGGFGERGEDLERAKERDVRRRALVVDNYMVTPDRESGSVRMINLFRILQGLGFKVTFAAANLEAPEPYVADLQRIGVEVLYRPYVRRIRDHLASHGNDYDLVILSRADAAAATLDAARTHCTKARIVFDTVDLHFLRERRLAQLQGDRATLRVAERRKAQELGLMRRADLTFVVSEAERDILAVEAPDVRVHVVSNIHRVFGSAKPFEARRGILFIGAFAHPPNTDAVLFLCREIMPLLRERSRHPTQRHRADPPREVLACAGPDIEILGYVPDVEPFFAGCRVSVAPLRYGAGVKGKINQSLAHGLPVVATRVAAEGMHLVDGESVLIADDAPAFAEAIARLDRDPAALAASLRRRHPGDGDPFRLRRRRAGAARGARPGGERMSTGASVPAVSVIVVNYNAGDLLSACVGAVLGSDVSVEVVVSDNGSDDGSLSSSCARCSARIRD
jgi:O-antigen biosynthesis protein